MLRELDKAAARDLVGEYLAAMEPPGSDVWVITRVETADWGWVIYWANRRAAEGSHAIADMYAGAGPFLVDRRTGRVALCGSAYPAEHYIGLWRGGQLPDEPRPARRGTLPGPWLDLCPRPGDALGRTRDAMAAELRRELVPGHPLHGEPAEPLVKCGHCDDVVFALPGGRFAIVHLTWTRKDESLPPRRNHLQRMGPSPIRNGPAWDRLTVSGPRSKAVSVPASIAGHCHSSPGRQRAHLPLPGRGLSKMILPVSELHV